MLSYLLDYFYIGLVFQALGGTGDEGDSIPWSSRKLARGDPSGDGDSNNLMTSSSRLASEVIGKENRLVSEHVVMLTLILV